MFDLHSVPRLHMLDELESGLKLLSKWNTAAGSPDDQHQHAPPDPKAEFDSLVTLWNERTNVVQQSNRVLEPLLALRRSVLGLFATVVAAPSANPGGEQQRLGKSLESLKPAIAEQLDRSWLLSAKAARK
jgi:hypothetical protein